MAGKKNANDQLLLDCSVAIAWYFRDEADAFADAILSKVERLEFVVPVIWHLEMSNILLVGERRKRGTEAQATKWLKLVSSLPIAVDNESIQRSWTDILALGRAYSLSAYDAAYLELAIRRGLPLATLDSQLKKAAVSAGIAEYKP
jgi:predicted nucleic acid-binding protein